MLINNVKEKIRNLALINELKGVEVVEIAVTEGQITIFLHINDFIEVVSRRSGICSGMCEDNHLVLVTRWYAFGLGDVVVKTSLYT